jgi:hypothetical protein
MSDQTTDTTQTEAQAPAAPQLQLSDLMLAAQVIQVASQRGAVKAEEMEQVGGLYNRLVTFLQGSGALQPSTPPQETATTDTPSA